MGGRLPEVEAADGAATLLCWPSRATAGPGMSSCRCCPRDALGLGKVLQGTTT